MVGFEANTEEECLALQQFKEVVADLELEDYVLIRYLRARNLDLPKAENMLRNAIQWREEIEIKDYLKWEFPPYYKDDLAYHFFGKDHEGAPILWVPIGKWNGKAIVESDDHDTILRWGWTIVERGLKTIEEHKAKGNVIIDLEGLSYSQVTHIASLKLFYYACQKIEASYPEIVKSVMIINAPWVFTIGFNFVKGIISKQTMDKIAIYGSNKDEWLQVLTDKFPTDSIIPQLVSDVNGN